MVMASPSSFSLTRQVLWFRLVFLTLIYSRCTDMLAWIDSKLVIAKGFIWPSIVSGYIEKLLRFVVNLIFLFFFPPSSKGPPSPELLSFVFLRRTIVTVAMVSSSSHQLILALPTSSLKFPSE